MKSKKIIFIILFIILIAIFTIIFLTSNMLKPKTTSKRLNTVQFNHVTVNKLMTLKKKCKCKYKIK